MANTIKIKNSGTASAVPSSLQFGELGLNYADGKIYFKNSSNVIVDYSTIVAAGAGSSVIVSDTAPSSPGVGDIWYESDTGKMFIYYDSFWVEPIASTGPAGIAIQNTAPSSTSILWADTSVTGVGVVPVGGTTGQVLSKGSNTSYDAVWANAVSSSDLALKANIASPTFTGTVTIPAGASISGFAPLANAPLTGVPTAPTASAGTNTTQLATTGFVTTAVSNVRAGAVPNFLVYLSGSNGTATSGATIAYNSEVYDDTNNVTSGVFTVPTGQAGVYSFTAHVNAYNLGTSGYMRGCIVTTGTYAGTYFGSSYPASGGVDHYVEISLITKLDVGDTVKCIFSVPATGLYSAGLSYNNFSGVRVA